MASLPNFYLSIIGLGKNIFFGKEWNLVILLNLFNLKYIQACVLINYEWN